MLITLGTFVVEEYVKPDLISGNRLFFGGKDSRKLGGTSYVAVADQARVPLVPGMAVPSSAVTTLYSTFQKGQEKPIVIAFFLADGADIPLIIGTVGKGAVCVASVASSAVSFSDALAQRKPSGVPAVREVVAALNKWTAQRAAEYAAATTSTRSDGRGSRSSAY